MSAKRSFFAGFFLCFFWLLLGSSLVFFFSPKGAKVLGAINQSSSRACKGIVLYKNPSWEPLTLLSLETLTENTPLFIATSPAQNGSIYSKARFRVRASGQYSDWQETELKNAQGEFYLSYTIPVGVTNLAIEAELYRIDGTWE